MLASTTPSAVCRLVRSGRVWLCDDDLGVSRAVAYALAQDARGYLWVGTEDGPALFDGLAWSTPASLSALGGRVTKAFAATSDGRLWLGTDGAGLAAVDLAATPYQVAAHLDQTRGLPSARVHTLCHAGDAGADGGRVWVGTHDGLTLVRGDRVERVLTTRDGLPSATVWGLCRDPHGRLWVATKGGLAVLDRTGRALRTPLRGAGAARAATTGVHAVCCDARGRVWVALVDGDLLCADATEGTGTGSLRLRPIHATGARVRALCSDARGRLWIGTSAGALVLEDDAVRGAWTVADGLPAKEVWALCADGEGRVWASTMAGLALLEDRAVPARAPVPSSERPPAPVYALAADHQGRMWLGTEGGLVTVDRTTERPLPLPPLPPALAHETVWALELDQCGHLWVGTDRDGLLCIDPASGALRAHVTLAKHAPVLCLEGERRLWAGLTGRGVVGVDVETGVVTHRIGTAEGLPDAHVQGLALDARGRLWAATWAGGLACLDPARGVVLHTLSLGDAHAHHALLDLTRDVAGTLWVATAGGGLVGVDPEGDGGRGAVVRALTTREGLPSDIVYACRAEPRGPGEGTHLWLGTRRGVARWTPDTERCLTLGRSLGLPGDECNSHALFLAAPATSSAAPATSSAASATSSAADDAAGSARLWVGTVQGAGIVALDKIPEEVPPCAVHLTGLTVMGQERIVPSGADLEIEDSDYDLAVAYGAVTFTAAAQVVYRAQLVGLEAAWSAPTPQRVARYTNLRPGAYTFRVAARNWGGQWSAPVEVPFRIVRNRAAREMEEALERERIDKEVAQATAALFERLATLDGLTGLLNRRALDERLVQEVERARRHGHPLAVALADIDHFKRINDTYGHLTGDEVLKAVARLCQAGVRGGDSVGRYGGEEIALLLPETTARAGVALCERMRRGVETYDWNSIAPGLQVTLSIGLAARPDAPPPATLLADADTHLYRAKQGGRNRTSSVASACERAS